MIASTNYIYLLIDKTQKQNVVCMHEKIYNYQQFHVEGTVMTLLSYTHMKLQIYCIPYYTKESKFSIILLFYESIGHSN